MKVINPEELAQGFKVFKRGPRMVAESFCGKTADTMHYPFKSQYENEMLVLELLFYQEKWNPNNVTLVRTGNEDYSGFVVYTIINVEE